MQHGRLGAALLIALAVLVIAVTATAMLARASATAQMHLRLERNDDLMFDLLLSIDQIILDWLKREASGIVLPPDAAEPRVPLLHDMIQSGDSTIEVRITAWDQCGMAPLHMLTSGSPVRSALLPSVLDRLDRVDTSDREPPGLDLFSAAQPPRPATIALFPAAPDTAPILFTSERDRIAAHEGSGSRSSATPPPVAEDVSSVGATIATHNPAPSAINVNTAPRGLLESVMRDLGRGGIERIMASRAEGTSARAAGATPRREDQTAPAHLVTQSSSWAFRIDLAVEPFQQSWWAVYSNRDPDRVWKCVQRIAITE